MPLSAGAWENILGNSATDLRDDAAPALAAQGETPEPEQREFAATEPNGDPAAGTDWWSESTDGQCSESAALFAASQPAPLSIV